MFLVNEISTGLILVELFYVQNPTFNSDYFDELRNVIKDIERSNPRIGAREFCLEVLARYLNSSCSKYRFIRKFIAFCKSLSV